MAAPVSRGDELELHVDSLAYGGNGVARLNGFVVFVRRGLPGDTVRAEVTKVKRGFAEATATEVLVPSAERTDAPCKHYHEGCGGCRFQDLRYEAQIAAKEAQVGDALRRIGRIAEPPLEPILPAVEQFHYRNKLEYSFTATPRGAALGFHRAGRWDEVLEVDRCWLTTDLGNSIREAVRDWAQEEGLPPFDQEAHTGYLRHLVVREGRNTGQALVQLVTAPGDLQGADRLVAALREFPEVRSIHWAVNDSPAEVTNLPTNLLWGEEAIEEQILGLRFRVRPNAFMQTNTAMAERLYDLAIEFAGLAGGETVYDLYCGTGTIGLAMSSRVLTVWGLEANEESVACAIENAGLNGITNAAFFAGEVGASLEDLADRAGKPDVAVVDPPRAGLSGKALRRLARLEAPKIVYVSCNPTTLAGNVKDLVEEWGYTLRRVKPVDMFPHTPHVESVALLDQALTGLRLCPSAGCEHARRADDRGPGGRLLGALAGACPRLRGERDRIALPLRPLPVRLPGSDAHRVGCLGDDLRACRRDRAPPARDARLAGHLSPGRRAREGGRDCRPRLRRSRRARARRRLERARARGVRLPVPRPARTDGRARAAARTRQAAVGRSSRRGRCSSRVRR